MFALRFSEVFSSVNAFILDYHNSKVTCSKLSHKWESSVSDEITITMNEGYCGPVPPVAPFDIPDSSGKQLY